MKTGFCIGLCMLITTTAVAHEGATGIVKARMDMMKEMGSDLKRLTAMARGDATYDANVVAGIGEAYLRHGGHFPDMFPAGSDNAPSEAAPAIWSDRARFDAIWADLSAAGEALAADAGDRSALPERLADLSQTCKACHKDYRIKR